MRIIIFVLILGITCHEKYNPKSDAWESHWGAECKDDGSGEVY